MVLNQNSILIFLSWKRNDWQNTSEKYLRWQWAQFSGRNFVVIASYGRILKANLSWTRLKQRKFCLCLYLSFLHLKLNFRYSSLSFVSVSWDRTTDKVAINWQNFPQVGLQLKLAFRIRLLVNRQVTLRKILGYCIVSFNFPSWAWFLGLGIHLFVKEPRPGDSEVTFSVFDSSYRNTSLTTQRERQSC